MSTVRDIYRWSLRSWRGVMHSQDHFTSMTTALDRVAWFASEVAPLLSGITCLWNGAACTFSWLCVTIVLSNVNKWHTHFRLQDQDKQGVQRSLSTPGTGSVEQRLMALLAMKVSPCQWPWPLCWRFYSSCRSKSRIARPFIINHPNSGLSSSFNAGPIFLKE